MAYTAPNTFTDGTIINASLVQENIDDLQEYINGGIVAGDISAASLWCEARHIMKGLYIPTTNTYEMTSAVISGPTTTSLPEWNPGYHGNFVAGLSDDRAPIPGTACNFFLDHGVADVMISVSIGSRGLAYDNIEESFRLELRLDGATNNYSAGYFQKDTNVESVGAGNPLPGCYRRRIYCISTVFESVSAGSHTFQLWGGSNAQYVPLENYSYSVQAYYQL